MYRSPEITRRHFLKKLAFTAMAAPFIKWPRQNLDVLASNKEASIIGRLEATPGVIGVQLGPTLEGASGQFFLDIVPEGYPDLFILNQYRMRFDHPVWIPRNIGQNPNTCNVSLTNMSRERGNQRYELPDQLEVGPRTIYSAKVVGINGEPLKTRDSRFPQGYYTPTVEFFILEPNRHEGIVMLTFCDPKSGEAQIPIPYLMDTDISRRFNLPNFRDRETQGILTASYSGMSQSNARFGINVEGATPIKWGKHNPENGYDNIVLTEPYTTAGPPGYSLGSYEPADRAVQIVKIIPNNIKRAIAKEELKLSNLAFLSTDGCNSWYIL